MVQHKMHVLIDTSVWVSHFRKNNQVLVDLLLKDYALIHPMILVEIACGTPPALRLQTLGNLGNLRYCNQASLSDIMEFIEREKLYGLGCGLVDLSLLASVLITDSCKLWTVDKNLLALADRFGATYKPYN